MTSDPRTMEGDPVAAALTDMAVQARLLAAARAFLGFRTHGMPASRWEVEAEDVVSIAKIEVLRRRREYDPARNVVAWIIGFIINVAREYLRKRGRLPTGPPPDAPRLEDLAIDLGRPFADTVDKKDFVERLMKDLKPNERWLLEMKYMEDLTFAEIAARIGGNATESAIRVRHHRILDRLRKQGGELTGEGRP